jgi:hypothetical protein
MASDPKFIDGLIVKAPNERAPDYVKAKLSIKREELIAWLQSQTGDWINADVKVSQGGKWYAAVDDWKPEGNTSGSGSRGGAPQRERPQRATNPAPADDFADDDIPFASNRSTF